MKIDKWITFTRDLLSPVMSGDKTVTRRVIRPQPTGSPYWTQCEKNGSFYPAKLGARPAILKCPYGQPGTILGVKEGYKILHDIPRSRFITGEYLTDGAHFEIELTPAEWGQVGKAKASISRNPWSLYVQITMPHAIGQLRSAV